MTTSWDISTASSTGPSYDVPVSDPITDNPSCLYFSPTGDKLYYIDNNTNLRELTLPTVSVVAELSTGSFSGSDVGKTITANGGVFFLESTEGDVQVISEPTTYDDVSSGNWGLYATLYEDNKLSLSYYNDDRFNASLTTETDVWSTTVGRVSAMSEDGKYLFYHFSNTIYQFELETPYVISENRTLIGTYAQTASTFGQMALKPDGTHLYVMSYNAPNETLIDIEMSTAWDINTATENATYVLAVPYNVFSVSFSDNGTYFYTIGDDAVQLILPYKMTTPWDITTASYGGTSYDPTDSFAIKSVGFSKGGKHMYLASNTGDKVDHYELPVPWAIDTAVYKDSTADIGNDPQAVLLVGNNKYMFVGDATFMRFELGTKSYVSGSYEPSVSKSTSQIDTEYWIDINSITANETVNAGTSHYAFSVDNRVTWAIYSSSGSRNIARNNEGTWEYNSNATFASETWTAASSNTEFQAIQDAFSIVATRTNSTAAELSAASPLPTLGTELDSAVILYTASATNASNQVSGISINYDANILNQGAVLGTDYNYDYPAADQVRITSLANQNLKIRVV
jgi:hypothetical protein